MGDEGLEAVVYVEEVGRHESSTLIDEIAVETITGESHVAYADYGGGHGTNRIGISTHGDGEAQCLLCRAIASLEVGLDSNRYAALTSNVKAVVIADVIKVEVEVIPYLIRHKVSDYVVCPL